MTKTQEHKDEQERRWQAVRARERAADGRFVYAVATTGVYCRPRRENVSFYSDPAAAERAGFRPCRRCRPQEPNGKAAASLAERACAIIERALDDGEAPPSLAALGEALGLSPFHLQRVFKRQLGISPRDYADAQRLARVKARLRQGDGVTGALYEAGYGSSSRLYERADAQLGMTPGTYRRRGAGAQIRYAIADSSLGRLLVAGTARGICAVMLGEEDAALAAKLEKEFPAAAIGRDEAALSEWVQQLVAHIEGTAPDLDLPLDLRATSFQWRVWRELKRIPYGATASYREISERIGSPRAARAVARACASNPAALVIPCHRVLRDDGELGGYRWGLERKARLLAREQARKP